MKKIGITGGIGAGKSYISRLLRQQGYPVYDCDLSAKELMCNNSSVKKSLIDLLGEEIYLHGVLQRSLMAQRLFTTPALLHQVNLIVHPMVLDDFQHWCKLQSSPCVFIESALLFQAHIDTLLDAVWVVTSPLELRLRRVMERDTCSRKAALQRIEAQLSQSDMEVRASQIIINDGLQDTVTQLQTALSLL